MPHHKERLPGDREAWPARQGCNQYLLMFRTGGEAWEQVVPGNQPGKAFLPPDGLFQQVSVLPAHGPGNSMCWGWGPAPASLLVRPAMGM